MEWIWQAINDSWLANMKKGNFPLAWELADMVIHLRKEKLYPDLPCHKQNIWNGEPVENKKVLIRCNRGLGDTIQFVRYIPEIKNIAHEVILLCQPELIKLIKSSVNIDKIYSRYIEISRDEYDIDIEITELPHVFRTNLKTIPARLSYIHVNPFSFKNINMLNIGIAWKAGEWNTERSIPFDFIESLKNIPGIIWYNLLPEYKLEEREKKFGVFAGYDNLYVMAQIIKSLDIIISVDTLFVHLAGALGIPVWNLLQKNADWRWMEDINYSPWYPSMRLFRQIEHGNWESVIDELKYKLEILLKKKSRLQNTLYDDFPQNSWNYNDQNIPNKYLHI